MLTQGLNTIRAIFSPSSPGESLNPSLSANLDPGFNQLPENDLLTWDLESLQDAGYTESSSGFSSSGAFGEWNGDKFTGGFGHTKFLVVDYWTMRLRSTQLFQENLYARGIIRRYITNEINTGIELESLPDNTILQMDEKFLDTWSENTESLFTMMGTQPKIIDFKGRSTWPELQAITKQAALVSGDVLVIQHVDPVTLLPKIELIAGDKVNTPILGTDEVKAGNILVHGVEINKRGEHVAFYVLQADGSYKRVLALGAKSKRRVAWLVYGTDHLMDDVRGQPLLSLVLQSLKEIDRYRDSTQRKALVNSFLAMFIKKDSDKPGTLPMAAAARTVAQKETGTPSQPRVLNVSKMYPGTVIDELQEGETPVALGGEGTDTEFPDFERAILSGVAWALELPPEVLVMSFNKNYSASQAALNEYKLILNRSRFLFGVNFCQPIYEEFLISQVLNGKIQAEGFLEAWRDPLQWDKFGAWIRSDWFGTIKPSADILKTVKGYQELVNSGFMTNAQATRELTGKKWRVVQKVLIREKEIIIDTNQLTDENNQKFSGNSDSLASLIAKVSSQTADETSAEILSLVESGS